MNVNLTPELERLVHEKVASGLYNNQSEVVREALRLLAEQDRLRAARIARLSKAQVEGLGQVDRGEGLEITGEMRGVSVVRQRSGKRT